MARRKHNTLARISNLHSSDDAQPTKKQKTSGKATPPEKENINVSLNTLK
jgi:hypothetical protein